MKTRVNRVIAIIDRVAIIVHLRDGSRIALSTIKMGEYGADGQALFKDASW
jgi:hypothetical protein